MTEETLFHQALDKSPGDRPAFLAAVCGGDTGLRRRVEALLRAHANPGSFLAGQAVEPPTHNFADDAPTADHPPGAAGAMIGPYKLLQLIGEGGMGAVWMAEQTHPVRRQVAVKLIKPGMDSKALLARFEAERQAIALMDHPNIAKVLDAGTTPQGRPYFVMELVNGVPVTKFCDDRRLGVRERVELVGHVCRAVQHAHQKGIIHRDLKPGNVLVALYDGKPVPKVIDFGVAKAAGQRLTDKTLFTGFGAVIGTPEYMSPEQAEVNQLDIDTRSDVFSLGVLLYELLTGSTPLDRERVKRSSILEILRLVREEEPPRPSTRLSSAAELPALAASRGQDPHRLAGLLRGELDWIVMKCLEKDRNRRYQSANSLADDLHRYLTDEPVLACPPSAGYRFRKFARRNKAPLATAALLVLGLGAGVGVALAQRQEAIRERDNANEHRLRAEANFHKTRQAVDRYYTQVSQNTLLDDPTFEPVRKQLLLEAMQYYQGFVAEHGNDPELQAELVAASMRISNLMYVLGVEEDWLAPMERVVELMDDLLRREADVSASESLRAGVLRPLAVGLPTPRLDDTLRTSRRACDQWEELVRRYPDAPGFRSDLATLYMIKNIAEERAMEYAAAVASARRGCELLAPLAAAHPAVSHYRAELSMSLSLMGECQTFLGQFPEAEPAERQAVEIARKLLTDYPDVAAYKELEQWTYMMTAVNREKCGRLEEAESWYRQSLAVTEALREKYPKVARFQRIVVYGCWSLADVLWERGARDEAAGLYARVRDAGSKAVLPDDLDTFAWFLAVCPDPQSRDPRRAAEIATRLIEQDPKNGNYLLTLGAARYRSGDYRAAIQALDTAAAVGMPNFFATQHVWFFKAMAHGRSGERDRGRACYDEAVALANKKNHWILEPCRNCAEAEEVLGLPPRKK